MDQNKFQDLLARYLRYEWDDDIQLWIVFDDVAEIEGINYREGMTVAQGEKLWAGITRLITLMLQNGFIAFDFVGKTGERRGWSEQDPKQVMMQIRNEWIKYKGKFPACGFIVWFHNGNKRALDQRPQKI